MAARRILIFSFVYYPRFIGGAEIAIKEITDRISPSDVEFDLIALRIDKSLPKFERIGNVNVYRIGFVGKQNKSSDSLPWYLHINKYLYPFLARAKAKSLEKTRRYDATWAMMANYSGFGALFFKFARPNVPFILTLQEGDPIGYIKNESLRVRLGPVNVPVRSFMYPVLKMIFTHADRIQTISNYLADFARDMGAKASIEVVPNGVDTGAFSKEIPQTELLNLKKELGIEADDKVLITTSRLVVKNAVADIIKAMPHIKEKTKLLILGTGYEEKNLIKLSHELGLVNQVKFLGYVAHKDMLKYLHVSDIFIRPSLSEGFGNSFIEAMAAGVPVIATRVGGIVDFLHEKETGLFCEVGAPEDIARKVEIYLRDSAIRDTVIDKARAMVIKKYDWNLVAQDMKEKVFNQVLLKGPRQ